MSILSAEDEITARLEAIPNLLVFEGNVPDGYAVPTMPNSNQITPYATVHYSSPIEAPASDSGITGAAYDSHLSVFIVRACASSERNTRVVMQKVWDTLVGFEPSNCGEISPARFGGVGETNIMGDPTRYAAVQAFQFIVNSDLS